MSKFSDEPWRSDYNPEKCFTNVLAVPGRVVQAREITEIGEIALDYMGRLGDAVLNNGAVVSGCEPSWDGTTLTITKGLLYLDGLVRYVPKTTITGVIKGEGEEWIGVKINQAIITSDSDPDLLDPASGYENFGSAGADRCRETVQWGTGEGFVRVYQFFDGTLVREASDANSELVEILARRTFDENGSYRVKGLTVGKKVDSSGRPVLNEDENAWKLVLSLGKAYVRGYETERLADTTFELPFVGAREGEAFEDANGEATQAYTYKSDQSYICDRLPVTGVVSVTGQSFKMKVEVNRSVTSKDNILSSMKSPPSGYEGRLTVHELRAIYKSTDGGATFTEIPAKDGDTQLWTYADQAITWTPAGQSQVPSNSSYYIDVVFTVGYKKDVDWEEHYTGDVWDGVQFKTGCSYLPMDGGTSLSVVTVRYNFRYSRIDMVLLTKNDEIEIVPGVATLSEKLAYPQSADIDKLLLAYVIQDNGEIKIENIRNYRLTQDELNVIRQSLSTLQVNIALTDLDREAETDDPAEDLNGIFTDGFINYYKFDLGNGGYSLISGSSSSKAICSIDFATNELTLPVLEKYLDVDVLDGVDNITEDGSPITWGRVISAQGITEEVVAQPFATDSINVNPYAAFAPVCLVSVDPTVDNWHDTSYKVVNETVTNTVQTTRTYFAGYSYSAAGRRAHETWTKDMGWEQTTSTAHSANVVVEDSYIEFMRPIELTVKGEAFPPNTSHIEVFFDDQFIGEDEGLYAVDPVTGEKSEDPVKYLTTDANGVCMGKFVVPEGHQCGTVSIKFRYGNFENHDASEDTDVTLKNALLSEIGFKDAEGETSYSAEGQLTTYTTVNTTTITITNTHVFAQYHNITPGDPVAQSFVFSKTRLLTGVSLFFQQKYISDSSLSPSAYKKGYSPVIVRICGMTNGYPNKTLYAQKVLSPEEVNVSDDASAETVVNFDQPVLCEADVEYCVVVASDTQAYRVFFAELGGTRIDYKNPGGRVLTQPYDGVMFTSSNHSTWTAHQTWDLTFKVRCAKFEGEADVVFDAVSVTQFADVCVALDAFDYASSGMVWRYSLDPSTIPWKNRTWQEITPGILETLNTEADVEISLKCTLKITNDTYTSMSPLLARDCVGLDFFLYQTLGEYISRYTSFMDKYNTVRVSLEAYIPGTLDSPDAVIGSESSVVAVAIAKEPTDRICCHLEGSTEVNDAAKMVLSDLSGLSSECGFVGNSVMGRVKRYVDPADAQPHMAGVVTGDADVDDWKNGFIGEITPLGLNWYRIVWYKHLGYTVDSNVASYVSAQGVRAAIVMKGSQSFRTRCRKLMVTTSWSDLFIPAESATPDASSVALTTGGTRQITMGVSPSNASDMTTWVTSDSNVATVNQEGLITAVGVGTCTITVRVGNIENTISVTVTAP